MRRSTVTAVAAALVASLAVAGCGAQDGEGPAPKKQAAVKADGSNINAHPLSDIKQGGQLKIGIQQWITQYNGNTPDGSQGDADDIIRLVMPVLFNTDAKGVASANPNFLTSAKVSQADPQVVEYELHPKAKWSTGTPLGWKDFEAQWKALNGTNPAYEASDTAGYDQISKVEKGAGEHSVKVTFKAPYADWQRLFSPLYPASHTSTPEQFNKGWQEKVPVSGSAFKVKDYDKTAQTVTAVPDPNWWGQKPKLDSIVYRALDPSAYTEAYLNKEIDSTSALAPENYKRLVKDASTEIRRGARWDEVHITLNGARGPLKDVKVRNAVQAAIDRKGITDSFSKDLTFELPPLDNHFFMPNQEGYKANAGEYGTFDLARAKKLLDEAGWKDAGEGKPRTKDGKELTLSYTLSGGGASSEQDQAELVQQMLGQAGIKVEIKKVPANDYFNEFVTAGNFDLVSFRFVDQLFRSDAFGNYRQPQGKNLYGNYGSVSSPKLEELLTRAGRTSNRTEAVKLYNEADAEIWKLGHSIELYQRPQITAVRKGLANFGAEGLASRDYTKTGWLK
ncbi:ABC transporter family substrate-binding protein [Streptomyces sp. NPDC021093]|uniref:ABC transporter family substrate-binding protein n=1 Tax=Streptomyces sp. NPDC021093 TaxID=3365112 RepID=UPI00378ED5B1